MARNLKTKTRKLNRGRLFDEASSFDVKGDYMSKRKNRQSQKAQADAQKNHFELRQIQPMTANQSKVFASYERDKNIVLHGYAGTGKTFISLYLALDEILSGQSRYDKIVIVRSVVPSRDMGFLPGNVKEKTRVYEEPYREICDSLFGRGDGYEVLKTKGIIEFTTTSFLRGTTFNNAIVIVDEAQNLIAGELYTVLTRLGENARLIVCGDFRQSDLKKHEKDNSLIHIMNILKQISSVQFIEFEKCDIVRSAFVKELIIKAAEYSDIHDFALA